MAQSFSPDARVAIHLMVQPNVATMFLADGMLAEQGLLSRVLATFPESEIGKRAWRKSPTSKTRNGRLMPTARACSTS